MVVSVHGEKKSLQQGVRWLSRLWLILGKEPSSILSDQSGCPIWPEAIVGSISHKQNICCVLVGLKEHIKSVGIDLEIKESLSKPMWSSFATDVEITQSNITNFSDEIFANMIFSAKEAFYKCIYPLAQGATPDPEKIQLDINKLNDLFVFKTRFDGCLWEGKMIFGSSYMLVLSWLCGKKCFIF